MPPLAEGEWSEPGQVAELIAGGKRPPPVVMAKRVDAEGDVMQKEHPHRSAPQQSREPAHDRPAQRHPEAERNGKPDPTTQNGNVRLMNRRPRSASRSLA